MITAFAWPSARLGPHDVPIVVTGPQAAAVAERLDRARPGAFDIETRQDEAAARAALTDREAYGAIVTTPAGARVLTASAASPMVAQQLGQLAQTMAQEQGAPAQEGPAGSAPARSGAPSSAQSPSAAVQDVVAADPDDPRGAGFGALVLPLIMSGIAASVLLTFAIPVRAWRAAGMVMFALLGGFGAAGIAQGWLSLLPGSYLTLAGVMTLSILAVAGTVAGLGAFAGRAGIAAGALLMLLVGNPLSAASSAPELLPQPWGGLGQFLPPGAAVTLLRSTAFFDGAGAAAPLTVLLAWAAAGFALLAAAGLRGRGEGEPAVEREPALV
ncbi:hypothetical protein AGRA3207_006475 [Actinomadura graeca]|uniref:ABC transporter permease n=2 Tax=Actinomadura graeca TaxID=2750812 RepID=A0ABX8RAA8_9ACTN|nr:hypothetical protein AGRA3207_006475 [Actinomadura graeca]